MPTTSSITTWPGIGACRNGARRRCRSRRRRRRSRRSRWLGARPTDRAATRPAGRPPSRTCRARTARSRRRRRSRPRAPGLTIGAGAVCSGGHQVSEVSSRLGRGWGDQAEARTTRVPAKRSWRPRWSWLKSAVRKPSPAGTARTPHISVRRNARPRSSGAVRVFGHDANAGRHLAERLPAGGERHQVAAVLHEQEREQRPFREDARHPRRRCRRSAS